MNIFKKTAALVLALVLAVSVIPMPARAVEYDLDAVVEDVAEFLQKTVKNPSIAQTGGDWTIIALRRSGVTVPDEYYQLYYDNARDYIRKCSGVLSTTKHSEYSRAALAMTALGLDARNIADIDIYTPMFDSELAVKQGVNGPVFALLALLATGNAEHEICSWYIDYILSKRLADGGFAMTGEISDPDTTALALTALSAYSGREGISEAIESGISRLSRLQRDTGGFTSYGTVTSESVSQVIVALSTLGIPLDDGRFVKNGNSVLDNLMKYYIPGKGFEHELGKGTDLMATEQALCALVAVRRQQAGLPALYDMSDIIPAQIALEAVLGGLPGKHPDISVPGWRALEEPFSDIDDGEGWSSTAAIIYTLARYGIVTGYPDGSFGSGRTLTRAESAAIIVRALGLKAPGTNSTGFTDVAPVDWCFDAVGAAAHYGIILGRGDGVFDPEGLITRQEAAVMIARAAKLCGMDTEYDATAARNVLSQFTDYRQIAEWASAAMAFCYDNNLLDQSDIESRPGDDLLRLEMAELTYCLLVESQLIEPAGAQ